MFLYRVRFSSAMFVGSSFPADKFADDGYAAMFGVNSVTADWLAADVCA